ncbi:hypothetical protein HOF92_10955 [bacterium]|jgi:hypothetical protein|nr:hypothetical protein [bacterium]
MYVKKNLRSISGVTLVEILVLVLILLVFLISLYMLQSSGLALSRRTSNKSESLQTSYICYQRLMDDLKTLIYDDQHPLLIGNGGKELSFYRYSPESSTDEVIKTFQVIYTFHPEEFALKRNNIMVSQRRLIDVHFLFEPVKLESLSMGNLRGTDLLSFKLTLIGDHTRATVQSGAESNPLSRDRMTLVGSFSLPYKAVGERYPEWILNDTSMPH